MESRGEEDENDRATGSKDAAVGWVSKLEEQYRSTKENAVNYPYVWASYIVVYGGFGLWLTYRWRKLRKTEDRVRTLQARLRKLVEIEEASTAPKPVEKADKASK